MRPRLSSFSDQPRRGGRPLGGGFAATFVSLAMLLITAVVTPAQAQDAAWAASLTCDPGQAVFDISGGKTLSISVEIADDPAERAQGLMFRHELAAQHGMLFIYEMPQPSSFWMRNTLIPLDIIFMDAAGRIRLIHENARPLDETPIPGAAVGDPDPLRLMVLEIGGGEAARLGLKVGQAMAYPALDQKIAAISCE